MADINGKFAIRVVTTSQTWTPISCPITCSKVVIHNTDPLVAVSVRTDAADPTTQESIPVISELTIQGNAPALFGPGEVICFVGGGISSCTVKYYK